MLQQSCDLCDSPAVFHETIMRAGIIKSRHLCRPHGLKQWRAAIDHAQVEQARVEQARVEQA